ncbi:MAG: YkgJ family cysteine cluster protein [Gammaproteobacteria bacterium]
MAVAVAGVGGVAEGLAKCKLCTRTKCCTYITQQIDAPRSIADFDFLLWQVSHNGVRIFRDDDGWFLQFDTRCSNLLPDGRCGIYDRRPQVCRDYSNDWCEFDEPAEKHYKLVFDTFDELDAYCRKRFKRWDKRHLKAG